MPAGGSVDIVLQWNDRFGYSGNDYDLFLKDYDSAIHLIRANTRSPVTVIRLNIFPIQTTQGMSGIDGVIIVDNHKMKPKQKRLKFMCIHQMAVRFTRIISRPKTQYSVTRLYRM